MNKSPIKQTKFQTQVLSFMELLTNESGFELLTEQCMQIRYTKYSLLIPKSCLCDSFSL